MRVLVASDRPLVGRGIMLAIEGVHADWPLRSARGAQECLRVVDSWGPDVAVVCVDLPLQDNVRLSRDLRERGLPAVHLVEGLSDGLALVESGADAIVRENDGLEGVLTAVERVRVGHAYVAPPLLKDILRELLGRQGQSPDPTPDVTRLSDRETDVLSLLRAGYDRNQIARELSIAPQTAKTHIRHVLQKLGVHSRIEAAAVAAKAGIPAPREPS